MAVMTHEDLQNRPPYELRSENEFEAWLEKGWWTVEEAMLVFINENPSSFDEWKIYKGVLANEKEKHIQNLVSGAAIDGSVKKLVSKKATDSSEFRASCKEWLKWATSKTSILLDPMLLDLAGVKHRQTPRSNDSFRPENEKTERITFVSIAKFILYITPKATVDFIIEGFQGSHPELKLPTDKTLRKWLRDGNVKLNDTRMTSEEKAEIRKKLTPLKS